MSEVFLKVDPSYLQIKKWQEYNVNIVAGFTTRNGGVSKPPFHSLNMGLHVPDLHENIVHNREILAEKLNIPLENWISAEQVHHNDIEIVSTADKGKGARTYESCIKGVDGLITNKKGILCTAFFADCVPIYFFDPITEYIGIAHAGWKGTVLGIAEKMVQALQEKGVNKDNLLVAIGPCISKEKYEVDQRVVDAIEVKYRQKCLVKNEKNRYLLDLKQLNVEILLQTGILRHNIDITNLCTYKDDSLFYSHRRDNGKTGRMLGFLGFICS